MGILIVAIGRGGCVMGRRATIRILIVIIGRRSGTGSRVTLRILIVTIGGGGGGRGGGRRRVGYTK